MDKLTILMVGIDANASIRDSIPATATLIEATNNNEAVYSFSKHDPDLVVIAADVPELQCIDIVRAIHSITEDTEVALLAKALDDETYTQAVDVGVVHFIETDRLGKTAETLLSQILTQVQSRLELQAGKAILKHLLQGFPHAAMLMDWSTMQIISVNEAAKAIGYEKDMVAEGFLFPPGWRETFMESLMSGSEIHHNKTTSSYGVWKTSSVMTSGKTVFCMAEDVTDAELVQVRIQQSENLLSAIFDNSYDAILLFDNDHKLFKANQRVNDIFGHPPEHAAGMTYQEFLQLPVPLEDEESERFNAALKGVHQLFEAKAIRAESEETFDAEVFLRGLTVDGRPMVLATIRDVTERRRAEVDFISIQRELGQHLNDRKAALLNLSEHLRMELTKCDMLKDKMNVAENSYKQVLATARNDMPKVQSFHLAYSDLSSRELQVIIQLGKGDSVSTIAENMKLSPKTISTYKVRAMKKLNISSESELILYALRAGLI